MCYAAPIYEYVEPDFLMCLKAHYGNVILEDFLEGLVASIPVNNKALLNFRAMYVPPGEPSAQSQGEPILTKVVLGPDNVV
jgi:hypothetical protein